MYQSRWRGAHNRTGQDDKGRESKNVNKYAGVHEILLNTGKQAHKPI